MKLGTKVILAFVFLTAIASFVCYSGYSGMGSIMKSTDVITDINLPGVKSMLEMQISQGDVIVGIRGLINVKMSADPAIMKAQVDYIENAFKAAADAWKIYEPLPKVETEKKIWNEFVPKYNEWKKGAEEIVSMSREKEKLIVSGARLEDTRVVELDDKAYNASIENRKIFLETGKMLDELSNINIQEAARMSKKVDADFEDAKNNMFYALGFGIFLAIIIGWFLTLNVKNIINGLVDGAKRLTEAITTGKLNARADLSKVNFEFEEVVRAFNLTLDSMVGVIDSIPSPVITIDDSYELQFINKAGASLGNTTRESLLNNKTKCYDFFKTSDCKTPKCACAQAMQQNSEVSSQTDAHPGSFNLDIAYNGIPIKNSSGKIVGALEFVVDQTQIKSNERLLKKMADYQDQEVARLDSNLKKIAEGNLDCDFNVNAGDKDVQGIKQKFETLSNALKRSVDSIKALAADANMLAKAAVDGKLSTRADAAKHMGDFRKIIGGVNDTLDAVIVPVKEARECLEEMAKGNLEVSVTGDYKGDHAILKNALNSTLDSMNDILSQVAMAVEQINSGARQVSDASQSLSQSSTEAASSLEEVSSSMQEVSAQTKLNADNATQANQLSTTARISAETGNERMKQMLKAMADINESAANISKIIKAIDEIAFQTNLLALNAAVEAARAGKHGKGFTVVAEEVRNLAQRSAKAAKETAEMIESSIKKTDNGTKIADETSKALTEIVTGATKVTDLIGEIASASKEQAQAVIQINQGLSQVDQVTQQNTATAEESASASEELSGQSAQLKEMLGKFRLRKHDKIVSAYVTPNSGMARQEMKHIISQPHKMANARTQEKSRKAVLRNPEDVISLDDREYGKF